jgi:hypothetical protein
MKKIITISSLLFLVTTISFAQQKKLQVAFNINLLDANIATELCLSKNSTLYAAIGFGIGSVSSINKDMYEDKSRHGFRSTDVVMPEIFFAPYLNVQYRNYFSRAHNIKKGDYTDHNSGIYLGSRLKMYKPPVIVLRDDAKSIKENYSLGLILGYQKALGMKRRFLINANTGFSTHANYNLSFFAFKPLLHTSVGYIIK